MPARRISNVPTKGIASSTQHSFKSEFELLAACLLLVVFGLFYHYVEFTKVIAHSEQPGFPHQPTFGVSDALTEHIVQLCMQQPTSFLYMPASSGTIEAVDTYEEVEANSHCPAADILLEPDDRSIGLCTDAALYIQLLGARLFPTAKNLPASYAATCQNTTARLFLEPLYESWFTPGAVHVQAPNFENMVASDGPLHAQLDLVLCKVHRCVDLVTPYLRHLKSSAQVLYTGHTSVDSLHRHTHRLLSRRAAGHIRPSATAQQRQQPHLLLRRSRVMRHQIRARPAVLHVRGKSSLKHSKEVLECWLSQPGFPQLTFVGPLPNPQVNLSLTRQVHQAPNIVVLGSGPIEGPDWPEFRPLGPYVLAQLQQEHPIHLCPSEREGFGHYINEARGAGALVIAPDHPPMNELVNSSNGLLIPVTRAFSQQGPPVPALGRYGNMSVSVSPQDICNAVAAALALPIQQRAARALAARRAFDEGRQEFLERMAAVKEVLHQLHARKQPQPQQQQQQQQQQAALQQQGQQQQQQQQPIDAGRSLYGLLMSMMAAAVELK